MISAGKPVTAIALGDLFLGKSVNTPGFLLAALAEERLLVPMQGKKRSHKSASPEEFRERFRRLVSSKGKPKTPSRRKTARQSPVSKKKARIKQQSQVSRKKKARGVKGS